MGTTSGRKVGGALGHPFVDIVRYNNDIKRSNHGFITINWEIIMMPAWWMSVEPFLPTLRIRQKKYSNCWLPLAI